MSHHAAFLMATCLATVAIAGLAEPALEAEPSPPLQTYGRFIQPDSVATTDVIKIAIPAVIDTDTVYVAQFRARYSRHASNKMADARVDTVIAVDSAAPFEALFDCSQIPDQDNYNLDFYCQVLTARGEWRGIRETFAQSVSLDRNNEPNPRHVRVPYTKRTIAFDGTLNEWDGIPTEDFDNGDNQVVFQALWNDLFLCFGIRVRDSLVFPTPETALPGLDTVMPVWMQDGIEIFVDTDHDRSSKRGPDDYQLMVTSGRRYVIHAHETLYDTAHPPIIATRRDAAGYTIEIGLSNAHLPLTPREGMTVGFNLVNSDREAFGGVVVTASFAGISDLLHHNPSEWATLEFVRPRDRRPLFAVVAVLVLLLAGGGFQVWRVRRSRRVLTDTPQKLSPVLQDVLTFLEKNYTNEKLDSATVAQSVNLSGPYLGRLIKRETGQNFREFLNRFRLEKARKLLVETNLTISEIAYTVGYTSPGQFSQVFSRLEKTTPSQFRKDGKTARR